MPTRRFDDNRPAVDPITNSDWDKLTGDQRADLLRKRHEAVVEALTVNANATRMVVKQIEEDIVPMLEANTQATERTENKVDKLTTDTGALLALFNDAAGASRLIDRLKKFGWVFALIGAAWAYFTGHLDAALSLLKR